MAASHNAAEYDDLAFAGWHPGNGSADADLLPDLDTMVSRSRDMSRNNGVMAGGMQTLRDNIVGATLRVSCKPEHKLLGWSVEQAREWGNGTEAHFRSWAETSECDAGRSLNLLGQTTQALGAAMINGDALALPIWQPRAGEKWSTRLLTIESDRLCTPDHLKHRSDIRGGVELDSFGAPVAYHILKSHPGDYSSAFGASVSGMRQWERIPAFTPWGRRRVIHLHDRERAGQNRGKPIVAAVMREFHMAGKYSANELQASLANSLVAAFVESNLDPAAVAEMFGRDIDAGWKETQKKLRNIRSVKGGAIVQLPIGTTMKPFAPGRPNQAFEAFMLASLRHIAAGMNMPYELLLKDFSRTNYSSVRAALLEAWRYFLSRRRWLTDYWLRPIFELWLEEAVDLGLVLAPDFYSNRYAYSRVKFIFGGRGWVDPVKEANAAVVRLDNGLSTLEKEASEQGEDWEEVLHQQAAERAMRVRLGLPQPIGLMAPDAPAQSGEQKPEEDPDQDVTT